MGADDANEGTGPGECIEHVFKLRAVTFSLSGAYRELQCVRCGAEVMRQPGHVPA